MKSNIEKVVASCVICADSKSREIYRVREHEYPDTTDDEFAIHQCTTCGLVFLNPRPAESELPIIYPGNYFAFDLAESGGGSDGLSVKSVSRRFEMRRLRKLLSEYHPSQIESVFDIGCGDGFDLDLFRDVLGAGLATAGIEMSDEAAARARSRGHEVQTGLFKDLATTGMTYDVVISKHVIEHVDNPREFLTQASKLLAEKGILVIDTPNVDSPLRRLFGRHWGGWHTPRHWYLFSPDTMGQLADQCGLKVHHTFQMPINMFWVWGLHSSLYERHRRLADRLFDPVGANTSGVRGIAMLVVFQILDVAIKITTRKTSQIRVVMSRKK